jgi:preprotein translocase subunit SecE
MARQMRRTVAATPSTPAARRPAMRPMLQPQLGQRGRGIGQFIGEVRAELRKVVWPTRREAGNLTALVIAVSVAMGVMLGLVDYAFSELFRLLLR